MTSALNQYFRRPLSLVCLLMAVLPLMGTTAQAQLEQQAYIKASNSGDEARFGWATALDGDTMVVAAMGEKSNATGVGGDQNNASLSFAGAVYVFTRNGDNWEQQAYIKASNTEHDDNFGWSVDISGDTLVVGAPSEGSAAEGVNGDQSNNLAPYAGAAYVFVREENTWRQQAYLKASNSDNPDYFGTSVAIHGDTIVVGAPQEASNAQGINGDQNDNSSRNAGAAYIFTRSGEIWTQQAYLKASNTDSLNFDYAQDFFGNSVDIHKDTIVIGAYGEDSSASGIAGNQEDESATFAGAVYVFVQQAGQWHQQAYIKASNTGTEDQFGMSVSIHEDQLVVGADGEKGSGGGVNADQTDNSYLYAGAAYVFSRSGEIWTQEAYLKASNPGSWDYFGASVSTNGNAIVVGAWSEDSSATGIDGNQDDDQDEKSFFDGGAAYLFRKSGNDWHQDAYIKASNTGRNDLFGQSVAIYGNTLAVGAQLEHSDANGIDGDQTDNSINNAGAVYVFVDPTLNVPSLINPGLNDAWYNPATSGQGFFITVFPDLGYVSLAWFTYDTELPAEDAQANLGDAGHRWLTAIGPITDNQVMMNITMTSGGIFDTSTEIERTDPAGSDGTITLTFDSCNSGTVEYDIPSINREGIVPIRRVANDNIVLCEALNAD